jgi:hypothetical protein
VNGAAPGQRDDVDEVSGLETREADLDAAFRMPGDDDDLASLRLPRVDHDSLAVPFHDDAGDAADVGPYPGRHPAPRWVETQHHPVTSADGGQVGGTTPPRLRVWHQGQPLLPAGPDDGQHVRAGVQHRSGEDAGLRSGPVGGGDLVRAIRGRKDSGLE